MSLLATDGTKAAPPDLVPALQVITGGEMQAGKAASGVNPVPRVLERYAVAPSFANPRVLLPLDGTRDALAAAIGQHASGAASHLLRGAARALQYVSRTGLMPLLFRDQIAITTTQAAIDRSELNRLLADVLDRRDFVTTMRLAHHRPNGKPVVTVLAHDGRPLAYAKFGWDDLTSTLVRHEADMLSALAPLTRGMPVRVPSVLFSGDWGGFHVIILAPLPGKRLMPRTANDIPVAASVALSAMAPRWGERLAGSSYWQRLAAECEQGMSLLSPTACKLVQSGRDWLEAEWSDIELPMGLSHGDWIPPNMSIADTGVFNIFDWEHGEFEAPLGMDALHFLLFVVLHQPRREKSPGERLCREGAVVLERHGLDPGAVSALLVADLLRSLCAYAAARQSGQRPPDNEKQLQALSSVLEYGRDLNARGLTLTRHRRAHANRSERLSDALG